MIAPQTITRLWGSIPIPNDIIKLPADFEGQDIEQWLNGRPFDQVSVDDELESSMPFLFLNDEAAAYYLGAYALRIARQLEVGAKEFCCDFAVAHVGYFLANEQSDTALKLLPPSFLDCLAELAEAILQVELSQPERSNFLTFLTERLPKLRSCDKP